MKKKLAKSKGGRPPWKMPPLDKVEALAEKCRTRKQLADVLGIPVSTFYENQAKYPEFAEVIRKGTAKRYQKVLEVFDDLMDNSKQDGVRLEACKFELERVHRWKRDPKPQDVEQQGAVNYNGPVQMNFNFVGITKEDLEKFPPQDVSADNDDHGEQESLPSTE